MLISKDFIPFAGHDAINLEQECETGHTWNPWKLRILSLVSTFSLKGLTPKMLISKDFIPFAGHDAINLEQGMRNRPHMKSLEN